MSEDENEKGFTVKDRRRFDASGNRREVEVEAEAKRAASQQAPARPAQQAAPQPQRPAQAQQPPQQPRPAQAQPPPQQRPAQQPQAQQPPQPPRAAQPPPPPQHPSSPGPDDDGELDMEGVEGAEEGEAGPLGFAEFVLSIATNAVIHMGGEGKDGRVASHVNLPLAAQHIDIIAMLAQKTRGNLTRDEAELMEALLYDLRMKYVSVAQSQGRGR